MATRRAGYRAGDAHRDVGRVTLLGENLDAERRAVQYWPRATGGAAVDTTSLPPDESTNIICDVIGWP